MLEPVGIPVLQGGEDVNQMPGLSSVATILVADAKPAGNRTEVDVWLYFNNKNWQSRVDGYLAKVTNPDSCAVSSPKK